jgi:hypothetical protein
LKFLHWDKYLRTSFSLAARLAGMSGLRLGFLKSVSEPYEMRTARFEMPAFSTEERVFHVSMYARKMWGNSYSLFYDISDHQAYKLDIGHHNSLKLPGLMSGRQAWHRLKQHEAGWQGDKNFRRISGKVENHYKNYERILWIGKASKGIGDDMTGSGKISPIHDRKSGTGTHNRL